jgi:superfamily I DNA/RNA helicase
VRGGLGEPVTGAWGVASRWADLADVGRHPQIRDALRRLESWAVEQYGEPDDVEAFLAWYQLRGLYEDPQEAAAEGMRLLTVHAAKGLEAPVVHVLGCDRGHWPGRRDGEPGSAGHDEALRLFYVAATRARDVLVLHTCRQRPGWDGRLVDAGPSPFLDLISPAVGAASPCTPAAGDPAGVTP